MAKPSVAHLRIFGCACYPVLYLAKRQKFKATFIKGVFVGYQAHSAAYKVFFPETGKLRVYRDIVFNETPLLNNMKRRHTLLTEEL
jgi:hypothetical protein